jgi:hypothetical protein
MKRALLIVTLALLACTPVSMAGEFYLGASAGWSSVRNTLYGSEFEGDDAGYKVFAGYRIIDNVAVEGSYTDLGSFSATRNLSTLNAEAQAYAVWAMGRFPLGEIFSVWVKLGLALTETDLVLEEPPETTRESRDDTDLSWGVGVGVDLGRRVTLRLEWEEYMGDSSDKIQYASLGAQFNF